MVLLFLLSGLFAGGFIARSYAQSGPFPILSAVASSDKGDHIKTGQKHTDGQETGHLRLMNMRAETIKEGKDEKLHIIAVFNHKLDYGLMLLDNPPRFIINLPAVQFSFAADKVGRPALLRNFRYGANGAGRARLVFSLKKPFHLQLIRSEALFAADQAAAWQFVWELAPVTQKEFQQYLKIQCADKTAFSLNNDKMRDNTGQSGQKPSSMPVFPAQTGGRNTAKSGIKPFIIVIDPGHGGFDSGAVGIDGTQEKRVTLAFAKILYQILQEKAGIKPYLTRETDSFLRLGERVKKARSLNADLFISIHADHIDMQSLRGATVYTLSEKASDDMAKLLAEHENKADLLDGLPADEPPAIADILLDMTRRETRIFSEDFARMTVESLKKSNIALIKNPHRFAGFQVLRAADIPSVLIELGYLSNMQDEKKIADPVWQNKMAHILADTITHYARSH